MVDELTDLQHNTLGFIADYIEEYQRPPSIRELGENFDISVKAAHDRVNALKRKGYLDVAEGKSRGMMLTTKARGELRREDKVPVYGPIAAGEPIFATSNIEDFINLPSNMSTRADLFALQVQGDSMIGEGILDGDIVILQKADTVSNGEIAAMLVDDEATLKRYLRDGDEVVLRSANQKYDDIRLGEQVRVLGTLHGLIRDYS